MNKSNWISKVVRIGAMAAGSAAFVAALVVAGDRMTPATAQAAAMPSLTTNVPERSRLAAVGSAPSTSPRAATGAHVTRMERVMWLLVGYREELLSYAEPWQPGR